MEIKSSLPQTDVYGECIHHLQTILASSASRETKLAKIRPVCEFLDSYRDTAVDKYIESNYNEPKLTSHTSLYSTSYSDDAYAQSEDGLTYLSGYGPDPEKPTSTSDSGLNGPDHEPDILAHISAILSDEKPNVEKLALIKQLVQESRSRWTLVHTAEFKDADPNAEDDLTGASSFSSPLHWNTRWQEAYSLRSTAGELKYDAIRTLAADFAASAERYGKIIISEIGIPVDKKTIKPVAGIGGAAGGEKYLVNGIFFKFALDFLGLYGGDRFAIKAAKHELKSLAFHMATETEGLHYPIMCLVQYCGFCLIATCVLPISKSTIKYGCDNAGSKERTVHADIDDLNLKMEEAAKKLNLKGHMCDGKVIHGPVDIEAHLGDDGRYYVLDIARLFPPASRQGFLYKLLRPELVMSHDKPLCSDSLSRFDDSQEREAHTAEIQRAAATIPVRVHLVAQELVKQFAATIYLLDSSLVADLLKSNGVNTRYLGLFYTALRSLNPPAPGQEESTLSWIVLVEMVSRCAAWRLREMWRSDIKSCKHVRDTFCKNIAVKYLTDLTEPSRVTPVLQALIDESQVYFGFRFTAAFWDKHKAEFLGMCMMRICALAGLQMAENFLTRQRDPKKYGWTAPDDAFDIQEIRVKISQLPMVALAHARFTMNHLQKSPAFKRIMEAASRKSLPDFRFAFANWVRFEFPVVSNVITACKNVPTSMCESMMTVCTNAATTMFKTLSLYWYKIDVTMSNDSLLSRGLLEGGPPKVAQLFLAYAKRYLPDPVWFLLLRMTFSIVHEDPLLLAEGVIGDPTAEDVVLLPPEEVIPILAQGRVAAEKNQKQKELLVLSLVEANLRFYHDNLSDKNSLSIAKNLFTFVMKHSPESRSLIRTKCRFMDVTGDPSLLLLKVCAVGFDCLPPLSAELTQQLSALEKIDLPAVWLQANKSRKLGLNFATASLSALPKLAPNVREANLAVFLDAMPTQNLVELIRSWSATLVAIHLPVVGLSSISSIVEVLQKCKQLKTIYAANHDRIQKFIAAAGGSKWLQSVSLLPLPS